MIERLLGAGPNGHRRHGPLRRLLLNIVLRGKWTWPEFTWSDEAL